MTHLILGIRCLSFLETIVGLDCKSCLRLVAISIVSRAVHKTWLNVEVRFHLTRPTWRHYMSHPRGNPFSSSARGIDLGALDQQQRSSPTMQRPRGGVCHHVRAWEGSHAWALSTLRTESDRKHVSKVSSSRIAALWSSDIETPKLLLYVMSHFASFQ